MNATPPPDNSNAVVPLPPSKIIDVPPRALPADLRQLIQKYADGHADEPEWSPPADVDTTFTPADFALQSSQAIAELNDRIHERTQAFLARERQLLDEVRLLRTILTDGLFVDYTHEGVTYTTRDQRIAGQLIYGGGFRSLPSVPRVDQTSQPR